MFVDVIDHPIQLLIIVKSIHILEVITPSLEDVIVSVKVALRFVKVVDYRLGNIFRVERLGLVVGNERSVVIRVVVVAAWCPAVALVEFVGEDLYAFVKLVGVRHPYPLLLLVIDSCLIVCPVHPAKEQGIVSHLGEDAGIGVRMSKGIDLPSDAWLDSKLFDQELMTDHMVVDHVLVMGTSLVVHRPSAIDHLELAIAH